MTAIRVALSIGANLGDREAALAAAVAALTADPALTNVIVSPLYETDPVGGVDQPDFLNAVVIADAELSAPVHNVDPLLDDPEGDRARALAMRLLSLAHRLEAESGRVRDVRWGPRTLDVDVLAVGDWSSDDPDLTIPHARAAERAFVLIPWADVDPDFVVPGSRSPDAATAGEAATVAQLRDVLPASERRGVRPFGDPPTS